jgi:hypothetical protein
LKGLARFTWWLTKWGLMLVVAGAVVAVPYFYQRMDEEIRRKVEARLAQQYPDLGVSVRSAQLVEGQGIELRGVSIRERGTSGPLSELVYLDQMFLTCKTDLQQLVQGKVDIVQISIRRPVLRAVRRVDGTWSLDRLLPLPKLSDRPPVASIEDGSLEIYDPQGNPSASYTLHHANLKIGPTATSPGTNPTTPRAPFPGSGPDVSPPLPLRLHGHLMGDHLRGIDIDLQFDPTGKAFLATGSVDDLELSPDLARSLPGPAAQKLAELRPLRARAKAKFVVSYLATRPNKFHHEVTGSLSQGRWDDARLPYPLTDLKANFRCDLQGTKIEELSARAGQATFRLDLHRQGHTANSPLTLTAAMRRMVLDPKLLEMVPGPLRSEWHKFMPAGEIDLDVKLTFDGRTWQPDITARLLNVAFSYHRFPYRLERARGTIEYKNKVLKIVDLLAYSDSSEVRISGELQDPQQQGPGWIEVRGENLRLDEKLMMALDERPREVVRSLHPYGTIKMYCRTWRNAGADRTMHKYVSVGLNNASIKYDKFPYPLSNIRGSLEMKDGLWTFHGLEGTNDTGRITCAGYFAPTLQGNELALRFIGSNVPMEEELRDALSLSARTLWNDMKPRGAINLDVEVHHQPRQPTPHIQVRAEPVGDTVSIEPSHFPYRLEKLRGVFTYSDGRAEMEGLRAEHGSTKLTGRGHCSVLPEGGWQLHLENLAVDRLSADRDLMQALPGRLKKAIAELHPTGTFGLRGSFDLASKGQQEPTISSAWNLNFDLHQSSLNCGVPLKNINGGVTLVGGFDGQRFWSQAELNIDSVTLNEYQVTQLMGPVWLDDSRVLLGFWADRARGAKSERHLTCQMYGGAAYGDGWVALGAAPRYSLQATLTDGSLDQLARQAIAGRQKFSGQVLATVDLRGKGAGLHNLAGRGNVKLRNADIYELPVMVSLLKILTVRPPDATAFTKSDIDFRIEGEHVYFDRIDFTGDAVSLLGKGEIGLNRDLRLTFHAVVGNNENRLPLVGDLLRGTSKQIMLIHVEGTVDQPATRREAFPGVNQVLQQLQAELQGPSDTPTPLPPTTQATPTQNRR